MFFPGISKILKIIYSFSGSHLLAASVIFKKLRIMANNWFRVGYFEEMTLIIQLKFYRLFVLRVLSHIMMLDASYCYHPVWFSNFKAGNYMFKVNNRSTRAGCEICLELKLNTPERGSGVFIVNFEYISHLVLVFLLLTLSR